jgi:cobalt/nickel transport system permease protein
MGKVTGEEELTADGSVYEAAANIQESTALLPDYDFKSQEGTGTSASGVIGAALTALLAFLAGAVIVLIKKKTTHTVKQET